MRKNLSIIIFVFLLAAQAHAGEVLTWGECIKEAAKNNPQLISAEQNIRQFDAAQRVTASTLYPQVSGTVNAATAKSSSSSSGNTTSSVSDSYSYALTGSQLVFDGLQTINNVNAAKENVKASAEGYKFTSSDVRASLRNAFANLLKAQEMVSVTEDIVKIRRDSLELITLRYESGLEHKGALMDAKANLDAANFRVTQARRDIELAQSQLNKAMGRKEFNPMYVKGELKISDDAVEKPDLLKIAMTNPQLKQLTAKKNSAMFSLRSAYGNFAPTVTGNAGAGKSDNKWTPNGSQWDVGVAVNLPILEGGLRFAQVAQAKAVLNQAIENERQGRDTIMVNLEQTWKALRDSVELVGVRKSELLATEERARISEEQYSVGFTSFDNWIIIQNNLVVGKIAYLEAQAETLVAEAEWIKAKGVVLEYAY